MHWNEVPDSFSAPSSFQGVVTTLDPADQYDSLSQSHDVVECVRNELHVNVL